MWRFLLVVVSLAASARAASESAWAEAIVAARQRVTAGAEDQRPNIQAAAWTDLLRQYPMQSDWTLQSFGAAASQLVAPAHALDEAALVEYERVHLARRAVRLRGLIEQWAPLAWTEGHTVHMSFIGYTEGLSDARAERFFRPGARLCRLDFDQGSSVGRVSRLLDDPRGMLRDVDVSFDRQRLAFAWKRSDRLDDYHIYEWSFAGQVPRQLTFGLGRADYEPAYLPDGDLVFVSTRPEQSVPCWWTEISNLYRMDANGNYVRRLAVDQVHTLYPALGSDGRLTYTRWDYSDRGQNYPHPVFSMRPDGQDQRVYYGGNSWFPTSLLHTRGIPGSHKSLSIAAGHHTLQQGKLVMLDTRIGRDEGVGMSFVAPKRDVPYERVDYAMQEGDLFRYPFPLSETEFLVSYKPAHDVERFGLYWMNTAGEREWLHADPELDVARMVAVGHKPAVSNIPDTVDYTKATGVYYVHDVYRGTGLEGVPRGTARTIRVVELDYRAAGVGQTYNHGEGGGSLNSAPVAVANGTWDVKRILGDVDIHADGSALFEVPAMASIYLQVLDERGYVIQTTRSWDTLRPGETKGCIGCHEKKEANAHPYADDGTLAWKHGVQRLRPFYGPARGFSFPREIQPILDARCVSCHDGSKPEQMDLRGVPIDDANINLRHWTRSYLNLVEARRGDDGNWHAEPETGLVSWISKMSRPTELPPYFAGAAKSRLMPLLEAGHHGVQLTVEERHKFAAWMDLLVPFAGDYREGNAWSDEQHAYYSYYEGKRALHRAEEQAALVAYMKGTADTGASRVAYRRVLAAESLVPTQHGWALRSDIADTLIDQVTLVLASEDPEAVGVVRLYRGSEELAHVAFRGALPVACALPTWLRAADLRIVVDSAVPPRGIQLEHAQGVLAQEVPRINGYHPLVK